MAAAALVCPCWPAPFSPLPALARFPSRIRGRGARRRKNWPGQYGAVKANAVPCQTYRHRQGQVRRWAVAPNPPAIYMLVEEEKKRSRRGGGELGIYTGGNGCGCTDSPAMHGLSRGTLERPRNCVPRKGIHFQVGTGLDRRFRHCWLRHCQARHCQLLSCAGN